MKRFSSTLLLGLVTVLAAPAQQITPVIDSGNPPNTAAQQAKHYVILVSLDGFRYDYPAKYGAPHIQAMAKDGASAPEGMLPSYPSLTFPNHLSIVTGLYPEHHGIVANSFFDPNRTPEQGQTYVYTQSKTNGDGSWYGGTPLWVLAEQQGMRSACLFWPGSEAEIQGKRPSYYLKYDDKLDDAKRVDQVIAWLGLPPEQRPHFITLYYSNVDHAGHAYGPDSDEVRAAVHHVDDMIGYLQTKLAALKLPVDLIVLADHGMVTLKGDPIDLSTFADLSGVHTEGSLIYAKDDADAEKIYQQFKAHADPRFSVYRRADVPEHLHFNSNPREGDPVVVPNGPYTFRTKPFTALAGSSTLHGGHGFDPSTMPEMKAIFFANGPDIKHGVKLPPFENVNIYPLIAELLDLRAPIGDGNAKVLAKARAGSDRHFTQPMDLEKAPDKALKPEPVSADIALKVGPGITPPKAIHMVAAKYTDDASEAHISGTIGLRIRIEKDGRVSQITITKGLQRGLDLSAVRAMSQAIFQPALKDGQPVVVEVNTEVNFDSY
jgi:alkaline phosphatase D